jgi:predicted transcriptional regulator
MQLAFMQALWARGDATVAQLREELAALGRALAPTTVATVLKRLEQRGYVAHEVHGRQFVYRAIASEEDVRRSVVGRVKEVVFGGDLAAMVSHLLDHGDVAADELAAVRALIARHDARTATSVSPDSLPEADAAAPDDSEPKLDDPA